MTAQFLLAGEEMFRLLLNQIIVLSPAPPLASLSKIVEFAETLMECELD